MVQEPCWDCIKGRHSICRGGTCGCPMPGRPACRRQPVYVPGEDRYIDPGEEACALGEADCSLPCEVHDREYFG